MKKLLMLFLALSMVFVFGCKKQETAKEPADTEVKTEETAEKENIDETSEKEEKKEEKKEPVNVENIKKAEDITTADELTALIEESNDPETSPERKEELLELIGEFLSGMEGQTIELPKE